MLTRGTVLADIALAAVSVTILFQVVGAKAADQRLAPAINPITKAPHPYCRQVVEGDGLGQCVLETLPASAFCRHAGMATRDISAVISIARRESRSTGYVSCPICMMVHSDIFKDRLEQGDQAASKLVMTFLEGNLAPEVISQNCTDLGAKSQEEDFKEFAERPDETVECYAYRPEWPDEVVKDLRDRNGLLIESKATRSQTIKENGVERIITSTKLLRVYDCRYRTDGIGGGKTP